MQRVTILILCLMYLCPVFAQRNDLTIQIHEQTLNKMLNAVGDIKGSNTYEVAFVKGVYHWTLIKPTIYLNTDSAKFKTDAKVEVGLFKYTDEVVGKVAISYIAKTNKIAIQVVDAPFEIYTTILGKKIVLKKIQIADYFKTPFLFEGPMTMTSAMEFMMPDSTIKKLIATPSQCDIKILPQRIMVSTELEFVTIPPIPLITPVADKPKK